MSQKANQEQIQAIRHKGGVLLSAGAGSGKTFVLKEHILYLCGEWRKEYIESQPVIEYEAFIKSKFRKLSLMTFTNKAAGELEIRLKNEFKKKMDESDGQEKDIWRIHHQLLDYLSVGTIHSFLLKLIKMGYFPSVPSDFSLVSESLFRKFMEELVDEWLMLPYQKTNSFEYLQLLKNRKHVSTAMIQIFSDPSLRAFWTGQGQQQFLTDNYCNDLMKEIGVYDALLKNSPPFDDDPKKKWNVFLTEFLSNGLHYQKDLDSLVSFYKYFKERDFKMPPKPSGKNVSEDIKIFYVKIKELKDFLKKNGEHLEEFQIHFDGQVSDWVNTLKQLVAYIEKNYFRLEGMTFSDLEYFVYKNLNEEVIANISKEFEYFIIDEFQDTSYLQYDIIIKLVRNNYNQIFCVGDPKQAIYGFRGGELGVFLNCQERIPRNLSLRNNYRSEDSIIQFNNKFFKDIFKKGPGFSGIDQHTVPVVDQEYPGEHIGNGTVGKISLSLDFRDPEKKVSNREVDYIEALGITEQLRTWDGTTAILYKRLKPSLILIDLLIKNNMGFTSQVKIPFLEDPIIGVFKILVEYGFNDSLKRDEYAHKFINSYLRLMLGGKIRECYLRDIDKFILEVTAFGLNNSFRRFLKKFGVATSNYKNNLNKISEIITSSGENIIKVINSLEELSELSYSLDFQYGENPNQIILMTAHASKGLQYKNIILGGVYTNDVTILERGPIGKLPSSFKWTPSLTKKKLFKSPGMLFEEVLKKKKEFSESKRLFYVACTRAEEKLAYVEIDFGDCKRVRSQSGAWSSGLSIWESEGNRIQKISDVDIKESYFDNLREENFSDPPMFHRDSIGSHKGQNSKSDILIPELSVTRFATVAECPKKFYLENFCKINEDELEFISSIFETNKQLSLMDKMENEPTIISSSERGTDLHFKISRLIEKGLSRIDMEKVEKDLVWTVDNLTQYLENYDFVSEKQIKFPLFGFMVNAIPDLVLLPLGERGQPEIWDFKTGGKKESHSERYKAQLFSYCYGLYILGKVPKDKPSKLVLCYIDEKEKVEQIVSFADVENFLREKFLDINSPEKENHNHCQDCLFQVICQNPG